MQTLNYINKIAPIGKAIIVAFMFVVQALAAQQLPLKFKHLTVNNGLSSNIIYDITQDTMGCMWFGSIGGLNRYDGYQVTRFYQNENDTGSIPNNFVTSLFTGSTGRVWIGTTNGLANYNYELGNFKSYFPDSNKNILANHITDIKSDNHGQCYFSTKAGNLYKYLPKNDSLVAVSLENTSKDEIGAFCFDNDNNLWVGFMNTIVQYTQAGYQRYNIKPGGVDFNVPLDMVIYNNKLWIASYPEGIMCFDMKNKQFIENTLCGSENTMVFDLFVENDTYLWVLKISGISIYNQQEENIQNLSPDKFNTESIPEAGLFSIYKDIHHNYWLGTNSDGVSVALRNKNFITLKSIPGDNQTLFSNNIQSVYQDNTGSIWVGYTTGIDRFNESFSNKQYYTSGQNINFSNGINWDIIEYKGNILIGNVEKGVQRFSFDKNRFTDIIFPDKPAIDNKEARNFAIDTNNMLWVVLHGQGVLQTNLKSRYRLYNKNNAGLSDNWINKIACDSRNNIWTGSSSGLSVLFNGDSIFQTFTYKKGDHTSLPNNTINVIYPDSRGNLWIGTSNGIGLYNYNTNNFQRYNSSNGLPVRYIRSMEEDGNGNLWIGTTNGLLKLNTKDFNNSVQSLEGRITIYDISDGLQSNEFNNASFRTTDGRLLFGGVNGITYFFPEDIKPNQIIPKVYISSFELFNKEILPNDGSGILTEKIAFTQKITLTHKQNHLGFILSGINYIQTEKNQYAHKLEKHNRADDSQWNYTGSQRKITYTNLSPGLYTLKYKAGNNDGVWARESKQITIEILPPWYHTWWARVLFSAVLLLLLIVFFKSKTNRIKKQKEHELDRMKIKFFMNISHEFRTPLSLILGPLDNMIKNPAKLSIDQIKLVYRNAKRLLRLINQLLDMRKLETGMMRLGVVQMDIVQYMNNIYESFKYLAERKDIQYTFESEFEELKCSFDPEIIEKALYNLISNAFKYTPEHGKIQLTLRPMPQDVRKKVNLKSEQNVIIAIQDSGLGIDNDVLPNIFKRFYRTNDTATKKQSGTGIGLSLTKELVELHKGTVTAESKKNVGSIFEIYLPVDSQAFTADEHARSESEQNTELELYPHITDDIVKPSDNIMVPEQENASNLPVILIVDDNHEIRDFLRLLLVEKYYILEAENGEQGLIIAKEVLPDLVISDIMMPKMNGIVLCEKIKNNDILNHIPVILLTAKAGNDSHVQGLGSGADDYISKPFDSGILKAKIASVLMNRQKLKEKFKSSSLIEFNHIEPLNTDKNFLEKFKTHIEENFQNPEFDIEQLCSLIGFSRAQLFRKVKSITNHSPGEFIRTTRLEYAKVLLENKAVETVSEAAYNSGYSNPKQFTRAFKEKYNMTPSELLDH